MFPEDSYLTGLGKALYSNNYFEWIVIEVVSHLERTEKASTMAGMTGGAIARALHAAIDNAGPDFDALRDDLKSIADDYTKLVDPRNDIIHARPITTTDDRQRLRRWDPSRIANPYTIEQDTLAQYTDSFLALTRRLSAMRPDLRTGSKYTF